jgi:hypothetical protein
LSWGKIKNGVPQGSIFVLLLFQQYINDKSKPVISADDTSITVANHTSDSFKDGIIHVFDHINIWLNSNLLSLNFVKTKYRQMM